MAKPTIKRLQIYRLELIYYSFFFVKKEIRRQNNFKEISKSCKFMIDQQKLPLGLDGANHVECHRM